ncbi:hypothetical protein BYT27DRAFT_7181373 [Phlegmacium glaucopus]|nr:hypothetical protein BYT27DRAFT_7181373 [Phlegmacium glaucopus]
MDQSRRWCRHGINDKLQDGYKEVVVEDRDNGIPCANRRSYTVRPRAHKSCRKSQSFISSMHDRE